MSLCQCGCGLPAPIAKRTINSLGVIKGVPRRFVRNHWVYSVDGRRISKEAKLAEKNPMWKGTDVLPQAGHLRARRRFTLKPCADCGAPGRDRHHQDANTLNNTEENVIILCRRCHMKRDGRLEKLIASRRIYGVRPHCGHGHLYTEKSTGFSQKGKYIYRYCKVCKTLQGRRQRRSNKEEQIVEGKR